LSLIVPVSSKEGIDGVAFRVYQDAKGFRNRSEIPRRQSRHVAGGRGFAGYRLFIGCIFWRSGLRARVARGALPEHRIDHPPSVHPSRFLLGTTPLYLRRSNFQEAKKMWKPGETADDEKFIAPSIMHGVVGRLRRFRPAVRHAPPKTFY